MPSGEVGRVTPCAPSCVWPRRRARSDAPYLRLGSVSVFISKIGGRIEKPIRDLTDSAGMTVAHGFKSGYSLGE
jgi:hypothetical protein